MDLHMQLLLFQDAKSHWGYSSIYKNIAYTLYFYAKITKSSIDSVAKSFLHILSSKP